MLPAAQRRECRRERGEGLMMMFMFIVAKHMLFVNASGDEDRSIQVMIWDIVE